ncbi:MAG: UvrD-helicase domain-containing protein [Clostridiales bacterium]|nr:UvrD-helicase domain-containing protein [Clostridiales bacterium]
MADLTKEQSQAVKSVGKVIVSASAGSGKTFVMIEKLTRAIEAGADIDEVLAVTFTKKAAAQMKEKLRTALIKKVENADGSKIAHIKAQISKIPSANISTIHSFCSRLLRTYFFQLNIDGGFDIMSDEDALAKDLKSRALDNVFERRYEQEDSDFIHLLKRFSKKRSDNALRRLVLESYSSVRNVAHYRNMLETCANLYTDEGFSAICAELSEFFAGKYAAMEEEVDEFEAAFPRTKNAEKYAKIFAEMRAALKEAKAGGVFAPAIPFTVTAKPRDPDEDKEAGEIFKEFKADISKRFGAVRDGISDEQTERRLFLESGKTAVAFSALLLEFDTEYTAIKRDENKLDYNDLEHMTLQLLQDENLKKEINSKYSYVFVDEYQDVNPVQEEIISAIGREVFLVGDVKQAIYGFRGSKSVFFSDKFKNFESGAQTALKLSGNFRSCAEVLMFVNAMFSEVMTERACGFDYAAGHKMTAEAKYPKDCGLAEIHIFGKDEKIAEERGVYSVMEDGRNAPHTREGLAVLQLVERELNSKHFDLKKGEYVDTQPGDICILTRKNKGGSAEGIIRALKDAGYSVSGAQEGNICALPEVRQMLDILSLIDNAEQDIPLVSAMLSPLGGFTEDELAAIRIAFKKEGRISFRQCFKLYMEAGRGFIAEKLNAFSQKVQTLRDLSEIMSAGELIDYILAESGLEAAYSAGGGEKLKNVLKLAAEGPALTLSAFLEKIKSGGYDIKAPTAAPSDSIKIMTMHAAKGLEFPVVIIADICRTFKGMDYSELPFDEKYGFAPKCYDPENMLVYPTILRKLVKMRADREELKNELNLFYVACTRAMCKLHILAEEREEYSRAGALAAKRYSQLFDMQKFPCEDMCERGEIERQSEEVTYLAERDENLYKAISARFMQPYSRADSVELPVKSSASAILKSMREDEPYFAEHTLFVGDGETDAERGTAYHRFLELCDFSVKSLDGIQKELSNFLQCGKITQAQAQLLNVEELCEIVNMPVFADLHGAELYREQEFLCRLKACDVLKSVAEDHILVQGAIDLLAHGDFGVRIIDYKYSKKTDGQLLETYSKQLELYKKAVSIIWHVPEKEIGAAIINIRTRSQINLN